jgi:hypothetical protein
VVALKFCVDTEISLSAVFLIYSAFILDKKSEAGKDNEDYNKRD